VARDRVAAHRSAAERHRAAAKRHEEAAHLYESQGNAELAALERRNVEIEVAAAKLEEDRTEYEKARARGAAS
jgi:hypothetical protein